MKKLRIILALIFVLIISQTVIVSASIQNVKLQIDTEDIVEIPDDTEDVIDKSVETEGSLETPIYDDSVIIMDEPANIFTGIQTFALSDQSKLYIYEKPSTGIVFLEVTYKDGTKACGTGFVIGKNVIATAGHLIYSSSTKSVISSAVVKFHYKLNGSPALGTTHALTYSMSAAWGSNQTGSADYGYLTLNDQNIYTKTGIFKLSTVMPTADTDSIRVSGYTSTDHLDLYGFTPIVKAVNTNYVKVPNKTVNGQSGGPYLRKRNGYWEVVAIHSRTTAFSGLGIRITSDIYSYYNNIANFSSLPSQYYIK